MRSGRTLAGLVVVLWGALGLLGLVVLGSGPTCPAGPSTGLSHQEARDRSATPGNDRALASIEVDASTLSRSLALWTR